MSSSDYYKKTPIGASYSWSRLFYTHHCMES